MIRYGELAAKRRHALAAVSLPRVVITMLGIHVQVIAQVLHVQFNAPPDW